MGVEILAGLRALLHDLEIAVARGLVEARSEVEDRGAALGASVGRGEAVVGGRRGHCGLRRSPRVCSHATHTHHHHHHHDVGALHVLQVKKAVSASAGAAGAVSPSPSSASRFLCRRVARYRAPEADDVISGRL